MRLESFTGDKSGNEAMDNSGIPSQGQSDTSVKSLDEPSSKDDENHLPENPGDQAEEEDDDAISIQTATDILLPIDPDPESPQEHKLGLDINQVRGWSGSQYDDYEYE